MLAYVVLYLPYTVQYVTSALTQINDNLLQAGRVFGGTPSYVFQRVTLPMISRDIFAGWMMIFIIAFRELVTARRIPWSFQRILTASLSRGACRAAARWPF